MRPRTALPVGGFAAALMVIGWLRLHADSAGLTGRLAEHATLLYIAVTFVAIFSFIRVGIPLRGLGFGTRFRPVTYLSLALVGLVLLKLNGAFVEPVWESVFGQQRDLTRFSEVGGSVTTLLTVLALSWTFAAFGEEIAFRIVLMRGIAATLGDGRLALAIALAAQAIIFGIVHAYQGPVGVVSTVTSGLIYGSLTLVARWSIWPAALAHGLSNTISLLSIYQGD